MSDCRAAEAEVIIKKDEHDILPQGKRSNKLTHVPGIFPGLTVRVPQAVQTSPLSHTCGVACLVPWRCHSYWSGVHEFS